MAFHLHRASLLVLTTFSTLAFAQAFQQRGFDLESRTYPRVEGRLGEFADVYEDARDAAVRIETQPRGIGSGFFISGDGLVMTAHHVVRDAEAIDVVAANGRRRNATIIGFDEFRDLAVLQVEADEPLPFLFIDVADAPAPGDEVLAIGNSRRQFNGVRFGEVTALERTLSAAFPDDLIAMTLPLAPGDSGGPVLNSEGEVIGVASAVSVSREGVQSYAAPVFGSSGLVAELRAGLRRSVPFLGVSLLELTPAVVAEIGYGHPGGLLVTGVLPGSGAAMAGVREPRTLSQGPQSGPNDVELVSADVITAVDGQQVSSYEALVGHLRTLSVGDEVEVTLLRGGETVQITVTLGSRVSI